MGLNGRAGLVLLGVLLRLLDLVVPKDPGLWVFGSLDGERFVDNPKYLFLHLLSREPQARVVWIARRATALAEARAAGGTAHHNLSPRGLWTVLRAGRLVISTKRSDVLYFFPRRGRPVFTLHHGMPIKKILHDYDGPLRREADSPLRDALWTCFVVGFRWPAVAAVVCTSPFYRDILRSAFQTGRVFVTGQPRTDAFATADPAAIRRRFGLGDAWVASYFPTHRAFGRGAASPVPLLLRPEWIAELRRRGIKVAYKLHPSMLAGAEAPPTEAADVFIDLSRRCQDPQELLAVTDCLVTDYSSVYIDFLLLDRPILFYLYDEEEYLAADNPVYFRLQERRCGPILRDEAALFEAVIAAQSGRDEEAADRRAERAVFHTFQDAESSARVWELLRCLAAEPGAALSDAPAPGPAGPRERSRASSGE